MVVIRCQISRSLQTSSRAGIDEHTTVVAYDSQAGANASRLWWLLNYVGHEKVYILDGGFPAWQEKGLPITTETPVAIRKTFKGNIQDRMLVTMETVRENIHAGADVTLIDSREPKRYAGVEELVDPKAGHIPTAVNHFGRMEFYNQDNLRMRLSNKNDSKIFRKIRKQLYIVVLVLQHVQISLH